MARAAGSPAADGEGRAALPPGCIECILANTFHVGSPVVEYGRVGSCGAVLKIIRTVASSLHEGSPLYKPETWCSPVHGALASTFHVGSHDTGRTQRYLESCQYSQSLSATPCST